MIYLERCYCLDSRSRAPEVLQPRAAIAYLWSAEMVYVTTYAWCQWLLILCGKPRASYRDWTRWY